MKEKTGYRFKKQKTLKYTCLLEDINWSFNFYMKCFLKKILQGIRFLFIKSTFCWKMCTYVSKDTALKTKPISSQSYGIEDLYCASFVMLMNRSKKHTTHYLQIWKVTLSIHICAKHKRENMIFVYSSVFAVEKQRGRRKNKEF